MAFKFQVRGTQLDAWYASGFFNHAQGSATAPVLVADAGAGVFGGSKIKVTGTGPGPQSIAYPGGDNFALTGLMTVLLRIVPDFTGNPGGNMSLMCTGSVTEGSVFGTTILGIDTSSKVLILMEDDFGNVICNTTFASALTLVSGTALDIWLTWDGTTNANAIKLYTAANGSSPTLLASLTALNPVASRNRTNISSITLGDCPTFGVSQNLFVNELVIWDTVEVPSSYGIRVGFIPTSAAQFSGYSNTDPGIANVRNGVGYVSAGVAKTGNVVLPVVGTVEIGTAFDTLSSLTGTYDGSNRWSDPGVAHVLSGIAYKANNIAKVGTLQLLTNTMAQLQLKQNPSAGQALVMTQGDAFAFAFQAIDDTNSPFDLTGASFSTTMLNADGTYLVIPNSQHIPDPDQVNNKGNFTVFMSGTNTLKTGPARTVITTVTVNMDVLQFRGTLNVLPQKIS